jgi:4-hydroxybenzoyl-CoA reductase subunit beta
MMRLPAGFRYLAPRSLEQAAAALAAAGPDAALVAGGTDLYPNMKRRQQTPRIVIGLRLVPELRAREAAGAGVRLGACRTLSELAGDPALRGPYAALASAASQVATPLLRNMGTLGGNLCLDTRCNYYDQNYEWRQAIDFCMKKDGSICWVAPGSPRCWAVSSCDMPPAAMVLGARVKLVSAEGERDLPLGEMYNDDGIQFLRKRPDEIVAELVLPPAEGWRSSYRKVRRRESFDFPVVSVATAVKLDADEVVESARIVLQAVGSRPKPAPEASALLVGQPLGPDTIAAAAEEASKLARPLDNTDFHMSWRKRMARTLVERSLEDLRKPNA